MFVKIFQVSSDEGIENKSKFVEFSNQKHFKIRVCVVSARRAKHLDSTHVYILSCKHISLTKLKYEKLFKKKKKKSRG